MADGCFIGIDQGSSSTKAVMLGTDGQVLFKTRNTLALPFREGLRVEQDSEEILQSLQKALTETAQAARDSHLPILGIGLSCQRSSCLAWNETTGEALTAVLSWRDTRGIDVVQKLSDRGHSIFKTSGLPLTPYYSASKFRALQETVPGLLQSDVVFGTLSSFLVQRLTSGRKALIDHTNAARTQLMNIRTLAWDPDLIELFGLSGIRLPALVPTAGEFGHVPIADNSAPILACIGDQQAAMLGLGVVEEKDCGINCGTGGFMITNTGTKLLPVEGLMASVFFSTDKEQRYLLEGSVNAAGDALEWLRSSFGLFQDYAELDDLCWKAATDTVAFIGINGIGAPHWEPALSSSIQGLAPESTAADVVRAVVEGIAFFIKDIERAMQSSGIESSAPVLSGGLSSLTYLAQAQADILKKDLRVSSEQEASALGAAYLAGLQQGTWTRADIKTMTRQEEPVQNRMNPGLEKRYLRWKKLHEMTRGFDRSDAPL